MIPFLDLKAQYASIKEEVDAAALRVLASTQYVLGEEVAAFEKEFATYCQARHAIAVNTGTSALHLALLAADIGPGDEVITVPFTFVASVSAICYTGARPVFVDIEPTTFTMDPAKLEAAITSRTKAIMPVHLYGQMADMTPIMEIAARHGIPVIEDACQAHGAEYHGKRAGSIGVSGCFSFYPGKNLGACGEGGLAVTNDDATAAKIRMLRDWGQEQRYHHTLKGFNYRMDGIQGAILRVKLRHLEKWTEARRTNARLYTTLLKNVEAVAAPTEAADRRHVYHIYAVRSDDREALRQSLDAAGIATGLHYPIPVHLQKAHADLGHRKGDFPVSEQVASEVLSVPLYPELTSEQIATVVDAIAEATTAKPARAALRVG
ncbi:erythromycin biosynthesis sensory transduction protein eryC1 [Mesorhizobium sp. Root552]|jgi:dTDP-4-amino-4,6-dideoxygalactose transaminase|uniref:DegT/DnrJ/EryC1/StrS family aminotransferase n=1 Tax=Mesorhizobium sp. Root552 TaxID=1736555 RepID=UPI0006F53B9E|nr:DegT/DnrJ/EryC1/StrS family aminotransferase [Mesorhizobium sp. Root552]KQZ26659.1 erythromycin biosynthesis sensory transduction protein eryC1 [Mesorhizobium sp. Root552]